MPCMGSKSPFHTWLLGSFSSKLRMLFAYDPFCSQRPLRWGGIHGTFTEFIQSFSLMAPGPPEYTPQCSVWHFCLRNVVYISLYFSPNLMVSQTHPCGTSTLCYANNVVVFYKQERPDPQSHCMAFAAETKNGSKNCVQSSAKSNLSAGSSAQEVNSICPQWQPSNRLHFLMWRRCWRGWCLGRRWDPLC